nr:ankyrin repeat domain-containing protein 7 [Quercus suber]
MTSKEDEHLDLRLSLTTDPIERRRLQNRVAQRKFRYFAFLTDKRNEQRALEADGRLAPGLPVFDGEQYHARSTVPVAYPRSPPMFFVPPSVCDQSVLGSTSKATSDSDGYLDSLVGGVDVSNILDLNFLGKHVPCSGDESCMDGDICAAPSETEANTEYTTMLQVSRDLPTSSSSRSDTDTAPGSHSQRGSALARKGHSRTEKLPWEPGWVGPLHIAAKAGHERIVRTLVLHHADCNELDSEGRTPLIIAVMERHEAVTAALLSHGASIEGVDRQGRTALHWAVIMRDVAVLRSLLEETHRRANGRPMVDSNVDAYDHAGWTALHVAVNEGFEAGVHLLLQFGANLDLKARDAGMPGATKPG